MSAADQDIRVAVRFVRDEDRDLGFPSYETPGSAAMDLKAAIREPLTLQPHERKLVPSGLAIAVPEGFEAQVRPRSGLALKQGVTVLNAPGTIDSDYRGEVGVILINHGDTPFVIERGMRIAQLLLARVERIAWNPVETLDDTQRGSGGFGHTGR